MSSYPPLTITRSFKASRQVVWNAWTKPDQFKQWYMPKPFSVPTCEFDLRPGGSIKVEAQGPDGVIIPLTGTFKIIDEPIKLIMTNSPIGSDGNKLFEIQHTINLTELDGYTTLEITSEVLLAGPAADQFLIGMKPGLEQALDQLKDLVVS